MAKLIENRPESWNLLAYNAGLPEEHKIQTDENGANVDEATPIYCGEKIVIPGLYFSPTTQVEVVLTIASRSPFGPRFGEKFVAKFDASRFRNSRETTLRLFSFGNVYWIPVCVEVETSPDNSQFGLVLPTNHDFHVETHGKRMNLSITLQDGDETATHSYDYRIDQESRHYATYTDPHSRRELRETQGVSDYLEKFLKTPSQLTAKLEGITQAFLSKESDLSSPFSPQQQRRARVLSDELKEMNHLWKNFRWDKWLRSSNNDGDIDSSHELAQNSHSPLLAQINKDLGILSTIALQRTIAGYKNVLPLESLARLGAMLSNLQENIQSYELAGIQEERYCAMVEIVENTLGIFERSKNTWEKNGVEIDEGALAILKKTSELCSIFQSLAQSRSADWPSKSRDFVEVSSPHLNSRESFQVVFLPLMSEVVTFLEKFQTSLLSSHTIDAEELGVVCKHIATLQSLCEVPFLPDFTRSFAKTLRQQHFFRSAEELSLREVQFLRTDLHDLHNYLAKMRSFLKPLKLSQEEEDAYESADDVVDSTVTKYKTPEGYIDGEIENFLLGLESFDIQKTFSEISLELETLIYEIQVLESQLHMVEKKRELRISVPNVVFDSENGEVHFSGTIRGAKNGDSISTRYVLEYIDGTSCSVEREQDGFFGRGAKNYYAYQSFKLPKGQDKEPKRVIVTTFYEGQEAQVIIDSSSFIRTDVRTDKAEILGF